MVQVHPAYDVITHTWYLDTGEEAPTLRELKKQLQPYTKIADYYPKGYVQKIIHQKPLRTPQKQQIQKPAIAQVAQLAETAKIDTIETTITKPTIERHYLDTIG